MLGLAKTLTGMPHTFAAFRSGLLNEWRATLVVKETICLSPEDRAGVDEELAADTGTFDGFGDKAIVAAVRAAAYRRDPASVAKRAARAVTERSVSLRPAPDTMTYLTALLPVAQGVAAYAALTRDADAARSAGDERSRGQVMADTLVERVTGTPGGVSGVEIQLVMTDRTLLNAGAEPARLPGYGTIPATSARNLAPTSARNGQGLCEACNHTKETAGWTAKPIPGPRHTVATTTPTGHTYQSTAPPLPGTRLARKPSCSSQEWWLALARATP